MVLLHALLLVFGPLFQPVPPISPHFPPFPPISPHFSCFPIFSGCIPRCITSPPGQVILLPAKWSEFYGEFKSDGKTVVGTFLRT